MPNNTWSAGGAGNWSVNGNWSLGVAPVLADDVIFDATSVQDCTIDVSPSVNSITFTAAYSGNWSAAGQTMTCAVDFSHSGTGTSNFGNGVTCNGNTSTVFIAAGVGGISAAFCCFTMNTVTSGTLDFNKTVAPNCLNLGANAIVEIKGTVSQIFSSASPALTFTNGGTLIVSKSVTFSVSIALEIVSIPGAAPTITGTVGQQLNLRVQNPAANATIPALTVSNINLGIYAFSSAGGIISLAGDISCGPLVLFAQGGSVVGTINTSGYAINATGIVVGNNTAGGTLTVNFSNSVVNCSSFDGATYNVGTTNFNLQTSQWTCSGDWTFGSNHTVNPGASSVTIANTSTITSNGKSFYDLTVNAAAKVITCADALTCAAGGDLTLTAGTLTLATFNLTVGGNTAINGASTLNATGSTCSFAGNYSTAVASTVTVNAATNYTFTAATIITTNGITLPSCTFNNNFTINNSCVITRLITGVNGFTGTFQAGNIFTITNYTAGDWDGAFGALSSYQSSIPGTQATFIAPAFVGDLTVRYTRWTDINANFGETIYANDGTSQNGGNNDNIIFPAGGAGRRLSDSKIAIGMGI
jgi:hypothetical protein